MRFNPIISLMIILLPMLVRSHFAPQKSLEPFLIGGIEVVEASLFTATIIINENRCTGSKVGEHLFLTAAHCLVDRENGGVSPRFLPGETITLKTHYLKEWIVLTMKQVFIHPSYQEKLVERIQAGHSTHEIAYEAFDIAFFTVYETTQSIGAAQLDFNDVLVGEELTLGGYGCEDASYQKPKREKYKIHHTVVVSDQNKSDIEKFNFFTPGKRYHIREASICPGDSGGPVYRYDEDFLSPLLVVGVNSQYLFRGPQKKISYLNLHTRISYVKNWIQAILQRL